MKALAEHAQQPEAGEPVPEAGKPATSSLRILLAEDNAVNQKVALRLLDQLGYRADVASNGLEALEALERQPYDVVLMDVQMPELDGLDASRRICERWPADVRPRIIAMTANAMPEDREACFAAGMDDYVAKPIRPNELAEALSRARPLADTGTPRAEGAGATLDASAVESLRELGGDEFLAEVIDTFLERRARPRRDAADDARAGRHGRAAAGGAHPEVERPDVRGRDASPSSAASSSSERGAASWTAPPSSSIESSESTQRSSRRSLRSGRQPRRERFRLSARDDPGRRRQPGEPAFCSAADSSSRGTPSSSRSTAARRSTCCVGQHFDLMLLDVLMPELDGYQVLAELKLDPHLRDIPVIMTSSLDELDSVVKCIEMGAEDYLTKPINPVLLNARITASLEKKRLRDQQRELISKFATKEVAEDLLTSGFSLGGKHVDASALFCDIRSFTTIVEASEPVETIELLNDYYTLMMDAIGGEGGIVNQMIGDGLMAIFGAPLPREGHRQRAVLAARQMVELIRLFNEEQAARDKMQIQIGIGIASGPVVAGYTGTQHRATYTCVGDTVNVAARLESHTKVVNRPILIDEHTRRGLDDVIAVEAQGELLVKGKTQPVKVYAVRVDSLVAERA